jgi:hypothetical protein
MKESDTASQRRDSRITLSSLGSALALAVSVFALALGAYQTRLMQSQARASVWPYLSIGYSYTNGVDKSAFIWTVNNNGVGPARIESVALTLDGKPMKNWPQVLETLGVTTQPSTAMSSIGGEVIPPNTNRETTIAPITVNEREAAKLFKLAEHRFGMDICYCSVYDECWIAHWQQSRVDAAARCESGGPAEFGN